MAPKKQPKKTAPKVYDYSGLEVGASLQVESGGAYYAAKVVTVSTSKNRTKAPIKVSYKGYDGYDEWVSGDRMRSKAVKVVQPEAPKKTPKATFKFNYFPMTALGEPIRMTFALAGLPWENEPLTGDKWRELKPSLPAGSQMPILHVTQGETTELMFQSRAILRYVGSIGSYKGTKLYPAAPKARYYCDEVIEMVEDFRPKLAATFNIEDQAEKEAARAALVKKDNEKGMYPGMVKLNERLGKFPFAAGDKPSIADAYVIVICFMFQAPSFLDGFPADSLAELTNITALKDKFCALPPLKEYYKDAEGIRAPFKVE
jgi:glutathione S-transferase